jgi:hypothetical protein
MTCTFSNEGLPGLVKPAGTRAYFVMSNVPLRPLVAVHVPESRVVDEGALKLTTVPVQSCPFTPRGSSMAATAAATGSGDGTSAYASSMFVRPLLAFLLLPGIVAFTSPSSWSDKISRRRRVPPRVVLGEEPWLAPTYGAA